MNKSFKEIYKMAHGWTIDNDGYLWGLTSGDQGFEKTDMRLNDLVSIALASGAKLPVKESNKLDLDLYILVRECQYVIEQVKNNESTLS